MVRQMYLVFANMLNLVIQIDCLVVDDKYATEILKHEHKT